jgi:DNA-binding NtrC family response regulator
MHVQKDLRGKHVRPKAPRRAGNAPVQGLPTGTESILFVDDEASLSKLGADLLHRIGYRAVACNDGREALNLFKADPTCYDLLITDQSMPGMTGLELAAACKAIRPGFPAIICTGHGTMDPDMQTKGLQIDAVLAKPVMLREMALTVRKVLNSRTGRPDSCPGT